MRRTGFARKVYTPEPAPPLRALAQPVNMARICTTVRAAPKTVEHRNPHLLRMAAGQPCLLRVPGVCCGDTRTTVACHSNLSIHGKAGARKADDHYSVWGCATCHHWLDQGPATIEAKTARFMAAHADQVMAWCRIVADAGRPPKDRAAAHWALCLLNAIGVHP